MQQASGQIEPAPHPARVATATPINPVGHAEQLDQLIHAPVPGSWGQVIQITLQLQQFAAGEDLVDCHLLGHVAQQATHRPGLGQGINAAYPNAAAVRGQQGAEDAQGGRLTSTVRTKQAIEAAGRYLQGKVVEGNDGSCRLFAPVALAELLQFDHRLKPLQSADQCRQGSKGDVEQLGAQQGCLR